VPGLGREAGVDGDPLADRAVDQLEHVLDQLGRRHRLGQQRLGAGEGEQPAGQAAARVAPSIALSRWNSTSRRGP
jgi:hypothetical protein